MAVQSWNEAVVDGQVVNIDGPTDLVASIVDLARAARSFTVFTLNLDHLVKRRADASFRAAYARATLVSADGWPVVLLARWQGRRYTRATGADLVLPLCEAAARDGIPVFFFGSRQDVLTKAADRLRARIPGLDIRGCLAPSAGFDPLSADADAAGAVIATSGARLCLVALGAPKQESFADRMAQTHDGVGFLCIGAALDFIAGEQKRAPGAVQALGLEWAWRLASQPRRLLGRYAACAALFAGLCVRTLSARWHLPALR